jgi:hypothetical protein
MSLNKSDKPRFEVADIVRQYGDEYRRAHRTTPAQESVLRHIAQCRTAVLGGHIDECPGCGHQEGASYNSCRDRHCPKCQSRTRDKWLAARLARLLPVPYFHVVFTVPAELNPLALGNRRLFYDLLFETFAETIKETARDKKHLGADPGLTAVLHTWGQNLLFHPHIHSVVTGGGLSDDGSRWVRAHERFFIHVKVLGRRFRGKFLAALRRTRAGNRLHYGGSTAELSDDGAWENLLKPLYDKKWVVYAKAPFGGPEQVFRYLGRYTHRVAISNHRILDVANGRVSFSLKDYHDGARRKTMTVSATEFLRRFLLHVLPHGFTRIRHFGLCAASNIGTKLEAARQVLERDLIGTPQLETIVDADDRVDGDERVDVDDKPKLCPGCGKDRLVRRLLLPMHRPRNWTAGIDCTVPNSS